MDVHDAEGEQGLYQPFLSTRYAHVIDDPERQSHYHGLSQAVYNSHVEPDLLRQAGAGGVGCGVPGMRHRTLEGHNELGADGPEGDDDGEGPDYAMVDLERDELAVWSSC